MFICLVVVVIPEHLSYPAELWGEGQSIGFFVRKEGELEEAIYINYKHRQSAGKAGYFFPYFYLFYLGGRGAIYWIFCSKRGWIGRGHSHKLQTLSKVLGRLAIFFLIFTSNVEHNQSALYLINDLMRYRANPQQCHAVIPLLLTPARLSMNVICHKWAREEGRNKYFDGARYNKLGY